MFSSILKEVTVYFDRRALLSSFFPSLVAWGLVLALVLFQTSKSKPPQVAAKDSEPKLATNAPPAASDDSAGARATDDVLNRWETLLKRWEAQGATSKTLLIVAFLAWVTFWSSLTLNFQNVLVGLFEGEWPDIPAIRWLQERRKNRWKNAWDWLDDEDKRIESREVYLYSELERYERIALRFQDQDELKQSEKGDETEAGNKLDRFLKDPEQFLRLPIPQVSHEEHILALMENGEAIEALSKTCLVFLEGDNSNKELWEQRYEQFTRVYLGLRNRVKELLKQEDAGRQKLNREIFRKFPPNRDAVMPTQLGNVLRAAELYAEERYELDAVRLWPHFASVLPKEFADGLQDSQTSFQLTIILSTYILLAGFGLSLWTAIEHMGLPVWALIGTLTAAMVLQAWTGAALVSAALILLPFRLPIRGIVLDPWIAPVQIFLAHSGLVLVLFQICYKNAVESGLIYGERYKAAIDLYRWKVLEALHVRTPANSRKRRRSGNRSVG
jgi:hypothetical protein